MSEEMEKGGGKPYYDTAPLDKTFINRLKSHIVTDLATLEKICGVENKLVAFDTETTGLIYFEDKMVGCSISFNGETGFYIPLRHEDENGNPASYNLPIKESIELLYNKLLKRNTVLLYNSTYDLTMVGQELWQIGLPFTDIETVNFLDVQCIVYFLEPEVKKNGLKWAERHFLGRIAPEFEQVTGISKKSKTQKHFGCLNPWTKTTIEMKPIELKGSKKKFTESDIIHNSDCLELPSYECSAGQYAIFDSSGTYALFEKCMPVAERMWKSHSSKSSNPFALQTDARLAKAMLHYKHTPISVNAKLMKDNLEKVEKRIEEVQQEIYSIAGEVFNLNSTTQKREVFTRLGIDTGVETKTGMSVSVQAIKNIDHPIVALLSEYSALQKRKSAYFEPLSKEMVGRINYKTCAVSTGRLSSGRGGENNPYFSSISVQTLPKSKNCMYEAIRTDENTPEVIFGYKFLKRDNEYISEHPEGLYVEGFEQETAIRPCLCSPHKIFVDVPEKETLDFGYDILHAEEYCRRNNLSLSCLRPELSDDWYVVSADISAEELCIIANLSEEPSFVEPLLKGEDLHSRMSEKMFGHKYDFSTLDRATKKNLRKKAKAGNFGLAYRGSYKALLKDIPDEQEAMEVYESWWKAMPIYKNWQNRKIQEMMTLNDGDAVNLFGRMRRFKPMLQTGNQSIVNSAIRASCNHYVQGIGADFIRLCMSDFYEKYLKQNRNFNEIRFLASIHDELAFCVRKDVVEKWVYRICEVLEGNCPKGFFVPFHAVPQIGHNLGFGFDFVFDRDVDGKIIPGTLHLKT